jgi:hypothetical protein
VTRSCRFTSNIRARETGLLARLPGAVAGLAYEIEGESDSYKAMHDEPELSAKPHASHHARVRGQFAILFAGEMERNGPAQVARERGREHFQFAIDGTTAGLYGIELWRSQSPPCCASSPLPFRDFARRSSARPNIRPQRQWPMDCGMGLETPLGSPLPDPLPRVARAKLRPFTCASSRPRVSYLSKNIGIGIAILYFFIFHSGDRDNDRRG